MRGIQEFANNQYINTTTPSRTDIQEPAKKVQKVTRVTVVKKLYFLYDYMNFRFVYYHDICNPRFKN